MLLVFAKFVESCVVDDSLLLFSLLVDDVEFDFLELGEIFVAFVTDVDFSLLWLVSSLFICNDAESDAVEKDSSSLSALSVIVSVLLTVVLVY